MEGPWVLYSTISLFFFFYRYRVECIGLLENFISDTLIVNVSYVGCIGTIVILWLGGEWKQWRHEITKGRF